MVLPVPLSSLTRPPMSRTDEPVPRAASPSLQHILAEWLLEVLASPMLLSLQWLLAVRKRQTSAAKHLPLIAALAALLVTAALLMLAARLVTAALLVLVARLVTALG